MFIFLLFSFKNSLHILDNCPLSHVSFAKIFSQFCGLSFYSLDSVFTEKNFKILMMCLLSSFSFIDCAFDILSKSHSKPQIFRFSSMLSSRIVTFLHFTFRSRFCFYKLLNWRTISKQSLKIITIPCDELSQSRHFCNYHTGVIVNSCVHVSLRTFPRPAQLVHPQDVHYRCPAI